MSNLPYTLLQGIWHKIDEADASRFICGIASDLSGAVSSPKDPRPTICQGCEKAFPAASLISTHEANMRIWKTAIACAATEDKREEILRFHKLAVAAAYSLGLAEARLAYENAQKSQSLPAGPPEAE